MVAALIGVFLTITPAPAARVAHPIHTTLTEVRLVESGVQVSLRVFTDDFALAVSRHSGVAIAGGARATMPDGLVLAYLRSRLTLVDDAGRGVAIIAVTQRRGPEATWIDLTLAPLERGARVATVLQRCHTELFSDQVNLVRVVRGAQSRHLVFTPGDGPKRLL